MMPGLIAPKTTPMKSFQQQVEINWPVRALYHYIADISNNAAWQPVTGAAWLDGRKKCAGSRYACHTPHYGEPLVYEVVAVEPYQKRTVTLCATAARPTYAFEFEPRGAATLVTLTVQVATPEASASVSSVEDSILQLCDLARLKHVLENEN